MTNGKRVMLVVASSDEAVSFLISLLACSLFKTHGVAHRMPCFVG